MNAAADTPDSHHRVWLALSELFLDTDVSQSRTSRARELADSPFSLTELEQILVHDVYPVCRTNLWSVAGVWTGFDPTWLAQQITARHASSSRLSRLFNLGRFTVPRMEEWQVTKALVAALRRAHD